MRRLTYSPSANWLNHARDVLDMMLHGSEIEDDDVSLHFIRNANRKNPLDLGDLLLAARFLRSFADGAEIGRLSARGNVTILDGLTAAEATQLPLLLRRGLLPGGVKVSGEPRHVSNAGLDLFVLALGGSKKEDQAAKLEEAMALERAVLVLRTIDALSEGMVGLPAATPFAAIDREILALLFEHRLDGVRAESVIDDLPEMAVLRRLSVCSALYVLRAANLKTAHIRLQNATQPSRDLPSLADFAGAGEAHRHAQQIATDLRGWGLGEVAWPDMLHSLLLFGAPGTGKTWLARAMATEGGLGFIATSFAEWQSKGHLGDMLSAMARSFAEARRLSPAILFIDEMDAVGSRVEVDTHGTNYRRQVINAFLQQLDSLAIEPGVVVVGACNDPTLIDPAILRPGRFDVHTEMRRPSPTFLQTVIDRQFRGHFNHTDMQRLARSAVGLTPAQLDGRLRQIKADARAITRGLVFDDVEKALGARSYSQPQTQIVAQHEAGHAVVAEVLGRGRVTHVLLTAGGGEMRRQDVPLLVTRGDYYAEMAALLAGRAAEVLAGHRLTAGAGGGTASDIARATHLALELEARTGLGAEGALWLDDPSNRLHRDPGLRRRVHKHLQNAENLASDTLQRHREVWLALGAKLLEDGYVENPFAAAAIKEGL